MRQDIPLLNNVRVAAPCPANWNEMVGGERVRYCRACEKNVYNLSEMTKDEAEKLLKTHEGRLCIRYYQRADGKILTQNCPVGLQAARRAYLKSVAKVAPVYAAILGGFGLLVEPALRPITGERVNSDTMRKHIKRNEKEIAEWERKLHDRRANFTISKTKRQEINSCLSRPQGRLAAGL